MYNPVGYVKWSKSGHRSGLSPTGLTDDSSFSEGGGVGRTGFRARVVFISMGEGDSKGAYGTSMPFRI